jgi:hypothetical protein
MFTARSNIVRSILASVIEVSSGAGRRWSKEAVHCMPGDGRLLHRKANICTNDLFLYMRNED